MKKIASLLIVLLITSSLAISQSANDQKKAAEKKAAGERKRSMGGYKTNNEMKDEKGEITPVKPTSDGNENTSETRQQEKNAPGPVISPNEMGTSSAPADSASQASNTPAVIQSTTSESGSPSILSGDNGHQRDGTGNVQRAKPNMAGAEVPADMNTASENTKQTENRNESSRIREEEETPAQITSDNGEKASALPDENRSKDLRKNKRKKAKRKDKNS